MGNRLSRQGTKRRPAPPHRVPVTPPAPVLVGTKLKAPPVRTATIERPALWERLEAHAGPALVVAPPGFGKTTLLAQWRRETDRPFAWVSLDASDNDPVVFWTYIVAAIRTAEPGFGEAVLSACRLPEPDIVRVVVPRLLNELDSVGSEVVIVLDDYHAITNPACHLSMELFLRREPSNVRLVISTRSDPPLSLGSLTAGGGLLVFRGHDLSFTEDETHRFLNDHLHLGLAPHAVATLQERTEGWPAGLYLAYLSLRDAIDPEVAVEDFRGSSRSIVDYLTEVVLDALDPAWRDFLLETSILERMCGPLCDAVTGRERSGDLLVALERANLFVVPLDNRREWYRYHHLFGDVLRNALHRTASDKLPKLHRGASEWLAEEGLTGEAIRHAIAGGEVDTASQLVAQHYLKTIEWGGFATIASWLKAFPRDVIVGDVRLSIVEAWVMSFLNRRHDAGLALQNAMATGYEGPLPDGASSVEASAALLRAGFPRGDVGGMLAAARRAFELESRRESMWRVTVHVQLGWALSLAGRTDEARPLLERGAALALCSNQWLNAVGARCVLAWLSLEAGDPLEAESWARSGRELINSHGGLDTAIGGYASATLGAVLAGLGEHDEGDRLLSLGLAQMRGSAEPLLAAQALLALARLRCTRGSWAEARNILAEAEDLLADCRDPGIILDRLNEVKRSLAGDSKVGSVDLTARELEVLGLLEKGLSKRQVGSELFVAFNTIHSHTRSIYRKLGASSRAEAIARAREQGLLSNHPGESRPWVMTTGNREGRLSATPNGPNQTPPAPPAEPLPQSPPSIDSRPTS